MSALEEESHKTAMWNTAMENADGDEDGMTWEAGDGEEDTVSGVNPDDFEMMFTRFAQEEIPVRVLEVKVEGNRRTRSFVIQDHLEPLKKAETTRELLREAAYAVKRIEQLGIFEDCILSLETGDLPGSVNVVLRVEEAAMPLSLNLASFTGAEEAISALGGSLIWKNVLGYGESWDATCNYGWDVDNDLTAGVYLPHFGHLPSNIATRVAINVPEWFNFSSYKVRISGVTIGFSNKHHDLSYSLSWKALEDDDCPDAPRLFPALKYSFKVDNRDSMSRPTTGYAFKYATQLIAGSSDLSKLSARQDVDLRAAIPLGSSFNAALNVGLSGGMMSPWAKDYSKKPIFSTDRFSVGRHTSLIGEMNGSTTILSLISRGLNTAKQTQDGEYSEKISGSEANWKGSMAITGFADLSFDLPWGGGLGKQSMYGHFFICAGNLVDLSGPGRMPSNFQSVLSSLKCFAGAGIVLPTRYFRIEVNFCQMLGHEQRNGSKRGIQVGFSSPNYG